MTTRGRRHDNNDGENDGSRPGLKTKAVVIGGKKHDDEGKNDEGESDEDEDEDEREEALGSDDVRPPPRTTITTASTTEGGPA